MPDNTNNKRRLSLLLLQESLWKIEDKMNIFLESVADQEAELIRLRRQLNLVGHRVEALESQGETTASGGGKNAGE